ncbi:hypothetical protein [Streptobacillus moniliformis]|uniref:DUF3298 domain-containing protein n=1 Tax=Streptobacillus moniliformis (strain ATCC 14647 / DSM 12112 / NCTC 10651 / 9901) TaxID=519441 RepID=D1AWA2_STRM9|nr:hypothetical protein [Streptobacillus moniliformis]ACZ00578.1 hypothetical protein Smon_0081 [Streptobacillus moniliformis DSM 12112]AVL43010.1 hypothetical protein CEP89_03845 [Streptobacillus moniliformis]QXW65343.1 hypothetical protein KX935_05955 [Streptobacillus moniliformis]SQA14303.1 Protein of uncharacterised function (DUF3298) [Streptobacillus moniliformis]
MKSIKKILIISILGLGFSTISNASFTFNGYSYGTEPLLTVTQEANEKFGILKFAAKEEKTTNRINSKIEKTVNDMIKDENTKANVFLTANNSKFMSVIVVAAKTNPKDGVVENSYKGLVFDSNTGRELKLSDIFVDQYQEILRPTLNDKIRAFGMRASKKYADWDSVSSFYLEEDSLTLIFDKGKATDDFDGVLFIPFLLPSVQQLLK